MLFVLIACILVASILIMESAGRISAKAFLAARISETHAQISSAVNTNQNEQGAVAADGLRSKLAAFEYMLDEIKQLDFSGATNTSRTIYAINHRLAVLAVSASSKAIIFSLTDRKKAAQKQLVSLKKEVEQLDKAASDVLGQLSNPEAASRIYVWYKGESIRSDLNQLLTEHKIPRNAVKSVEESRYERHRLERDAGEQGALVATLERQLSEYQPETTAPLTAGWMPALTLWTCYFPTDLILALSILLCGVIGAVAANLRAGAVTPVARSVALGAAAGFVSYLALKGGKFLFLVQTGAEHQSAINPYSAAFCGILAGLFTERAYMILSRLIDQLAERLMGEALSAKGAEATPGHPAKQKPTIKKVEKPTDRGATHHSAGLESGTSG
jgi:hypothetical protein